MTRITIQLPDALAEQLQAQAGKLGVALDQYVQQMVNNATGAGDAITASSDAEDFERALDDLFSHDDAVISATNHTWPRSDIYSDHD